MDDVAERLKDLLGRKRRRPPTEWPTFGEGEHPESYRGHASLSRQDLAVRRAKAESDWTGTPWIPLLAAGFDLLKDAETVWEVDFGETVVYADLDNGLSFTTSRSADAPRPPAELRRLALRATGIHLRMLDLGDGWPPMLCEERVYEAGSLRRVSPQVLGWWLEDIEHSRRLESARPDYRVDELRRCEALRRAGVEVYRLDYGRPQERTPGGITLWLAPRMELAIVEPIFLGGGIQTHPDVKPGSFVDVRPFGSRSPQRWAEYARLESEAAREAEQAHARKLLAEDPGLDGALNALRSGSFLCWRCKRPITAVRAMARAQDGRVRVRCQGCQASVALENHDVPQDLRVDSLQHFGRACPYCEGRSGDVRCIRKSPGEEWLAICALCGRSFPLKS